eukprot:COSAG06_NODE_3357_length_5461_cov_81.770981_5_plen_162_part_00
MIKPMLPLARQERTVSSALEARPTARARRAEPTPSAGHCYIYRAAAESGCAGVGWARCQRAARRAAQTIAMMKTPKRGRPVIAPAREKKKQGQRRALARGGGAAYSRWSEGHGAPIVEVGAPLRVAPVRVRDPRHRRCAAATPLFRARVTVFARTYLAPEI